MSKNLKLRTEQVANILEDVGFCKALAVYKEPFKAMLYQIQLASVTEENQDTVAPTLLALKAIHDIFEDVIIAGEAFIVKENEKKKQ